MTIKLAYKRLLSVLLFSIPVMLLGNSIEIILNPTNPYSFGSKDFGNATVINTGATKNVYIVSSLSTPTGEKLAEGRTSVLVLKNGANTFSQINLGFTSVSYSNAKIKQADQQTKSFPAGTYKYCIEVYDATSEIVSGSECASISLELLTPPILLQPENKEEIEDIYPYFMWIPPTPMPSNVSYVFTLVKVMEEQTGLDAILRNPPYYQKQVATNSHQYPLNAARLEKGETYAWQVKAIMNEDPSELQTGKDYKSESEVFEFTITPEPEKGASLYPFASINTIGDKLYYTSDTLKILYKEKYKKGQLEYSIYSNNNEPVASVKGTLEGVLGDNLLQIPINSMGLKKGEEYWLELKNSSGQKFKLKFIKTN